MHGTGRDSIASAMTADGPLSSGDDRCLNYLYLNCDDQATFPAVKISSIKVSDS